MTEKWKEIAGYEGFYEVSNFGKVRSIDRVDVIGRKHKAKLMATPIDAKSTGYRYVRLSKHGVAKKLNVHVLVLEAFEGPRPSPEMEACHEDGNRANPALTNLRWDTAKGNAKDRWKHGTVAAGEKSPKSVITEKVVEHILLSPLSSIKLAANLGISSSTVRAVRNGQNWSHITGREASKRKQEGGSDAT